MPEYGEYIVPDGPIVIDPRWGSDHRELKAEAIWVTMLRHCGQHAVEGAWLDIGCGSGGIAASLASRVERMIGLDPEPWARWQEFKAQHSNLDFHASSGSRTNETLIPSGSIDIVICNQVYEHIDDPKALLTEIHRVLRPGGYCYFAGPNLLWPIEPHVFWPFVHWLPRGIALWLMRSLGSSRADNLDAWSSPYWRLTKWFKKAGFLYSNAIHDHIHTASILDQGGGMLHAAACFPRWFIDLASPLSPAFVFILLKELDSNNIEDARSSGDAV